MYTKLVFGIYFINKINTETEMQKPQLMQYFQISKL